MLGQEKRRRAKKIRPSCMVHGGCLVVVELVGDLKLLRFKGPPPGKARPLAKIGRESNPENPAPAPPHRSSVCLCVYKVLDRLEVGIGNRLCPAPEISVRDVVRRRFVL